MKKCFVRLLSVLFAVALALSLAGCSSSNTEVTAKGYPADKNTTWGELFEHFDKEGFHSLPAEIQEQLKADLLSDDIREEPDIQASTPVYSTDTTEEKMKKAEEQLKQSVLSSSTQHFYNENESPNNFSQKDVSVLNFNLLAAPSLDDPSIEYMTTFFLTSNALPPSLSLPFKIKKLATILPATALVNWKIIPMVPAKPTQLVD